MGDPLEPKHYRICRHPAPHAQKGEPPQSSHSAGVLKHQVKVGAVFMLTRAQDTLSRVTAVQAAATCSVAVGAFSFLVSYSDLSGLAEKFSTAHPWSIPLVVDGLVIGATIAAAAFKSRGRKAYAWSLLSFGALLSIAGNGLAAWYNSGSWIGVSISAVPPLVLLLITHLTMMLWSESKDTAARATESVSTMAVSSPLRIEAEPTTEMLAVESVEAAPAA